jgi:hypothetical protein
MLSRASGELYRGVANHELISDVGQRTALAQCVPGSPAGDVHHRSNCHIPLPSLAMTGVGRPRGHELVDLSLGLSDLSGPSWRLWASGWTYSAASLAPEPEKRSSPR